MNTEFFNPKKKLIVVLFTYVCVNENAPGTYKCVCKIIKLDEF